MERLHHLLSFRQHALETICSNLSILQILLGYLDMQLFALGSNGSGQLGVGHVEDIPIPEKCLFDEDDGEASNTMNKENVVRIAAGGNHTLALFSNGMVYAAGCNVDGRCGTSNQNETGTEAMSRFRRVRATDAEGRTYSVFKNVSATWEGSFLVIGSSDGGSSFDSAETDTDIILALGSGGKGELGLGNTQVQAAAASIRIPNFPRRGTRVVSIASCMGHTAVVLSTGEVYGWGAARKGQLGDAVKPQKIAWSPVRVDNVPFRATDVACGREFTVVSGDKSKGEFVILGSLDDKWGIFADQPACLPPYDNIFAGWHAVYVHRDDGSSPLFTAWGRNDRGQLPSPHSLLSNPKKFAAGSEHALLLLDERTVVACGWAIHGNCGVDTDLQGNVKGRLNTIDIPSEFNDGNKRIIGLGAGCANSWIITT